MNKKETKISKEIKINKKSARRNYSNQTGITLIALVVTIVVLLILAGVSINAVFGQDGIIQKAKDAQNKMDQATQNDLDAINGLNNWIDGKINGSSGGNDNPSTSDLPSVANETIPYYPDTTFTKLEETNLDNGLVIQDESGNEYVWIEVPKSLYADSSYNTKTTTADQKPTKSTDYDKIEYCLHKYTDYYRNGTSYTDTYYSDATTGLTSAQYTTLKQKMLKSVYENGGFWIGRYEAGITTNRTAEGDATVAPLSKAGEGEVEAPVYPYTYVTCSQAQTLASKLSTGKSYTSSLMFGVQWDLVLKHIETKIGSSNLTTSNGKNILTQDSSSWGNYYNASFEINRGKYAKYGALSSAWNNYNTALANCVTLENGISKKVSASSNSNGILLTTGASDACKKMNIYDLAGNVWEWTLEYTATTSHPCANRGGSYYSLGSGYPASYRDNNRATFSNSNLGFRSTLFK